MLPVSGDRSVRGNCQPAADPAIGTGRADGHAASHRSASAVSIAGSEMRMRSPARRVATVCVQPSSGASAWPESNSMTHPCSGQATARPCTIPSESGPPRCGQRSISAKTSSSAVRKTAIGGDPSGRVTRRAPRRGMSARRPTSTQAGPGIASIHLGQDTVFVRGRAGSALCPRVDLHELLREEETLVERASPVVVVDDAAPHVIDADPHHPRRGALEVARLLAVELQDRADMLEHLGLGREPHQVVGDADLDTAIAAHHDFVAGLDANDANILDRRLGAITRTARHRQLDFVRRPRAPAHLLDLDAEPGRILGPKAAPFAADAGLHGAQALGVGMARDQTGVIEVGPDRRQLLLLDAEHVDALPAGDLNRRHLVLFDGIGNCAQLARIGQAAPHPRYHREGAVLLDVGVRPLIDEARLRVVAITVGPGTEQKIIQRRPAFLATILRLPAQGGAYFGDRLEAVLQYGSAHRIMAVLGAFAERRVFAPHYGTAAE